MLWRRRPTARFRESVSAEPLNHYTATTATREAVRRQSNNNWGRKKPGGATTSVRNWVAERPPSGTLSPPPTKDARAGGPPTGTPGENDAVTLAAAWPSFLPHCQNRRRATANARGPLDQGLFMRTRAAPTTPNTLPYAVAIFVAS